MAAERESVFDRCYLGADAMLHSRDASGSGLAQTIARAVAERYRASIMMHGEGSLPSLEVAAVSDTLNHV